MSPGIINPLLSSPSYLLLILQLPSLVYPSWAQLHSPSLCKLLLSNVHFHCCWPNNYIALKITPTCYQPLADGFIAFDNILRQNDNLVLTELIVRVY